jgi:hypothetical protein
MKTTTGLAFSVVLAIVCSTLPSEAHKGVTSKFTYNADVYPIFLNRCGHCHVAGGVGPMSLLSYADAFPWAESLRTELLETDDARPGADESSAGSTAASAANFIKAAHRDLPARELDVILDWATGGTPEGDPSKAPPPTTFTSEWAHGQPHVVLQFPAPYQMAADAMEATFEIALPIRVATERQVNAIDVLPGTPAIVREVEFLLHSTNGPSVMVGTWTPRQNPAPVVLTPPARVTPGSDLVARVHYKKTWKYEGKPIADTSTIGLYFSP